MEKKNDIANNTFNNKSRSKKCINCIGYFAHATTSTTKLLSLSRSTDITIIQHSNSWKYKGMNIKQLATEI